MNIAVKATGSNPSVLAPPLRWAGGKRWLVPYLRKLWLPHRSRRLVEPFVGGASIALGLRPEKALLADINPHLINFYEQVTSEKRLRIPEDVSDGGYYLARERFNFLIRIGKAFTPEGAALFYFLNRTGFNGLCRFNRDGFFNVPYGKLRRPKLVTDFSAWASVFANWEFRCCNFVDLRVDPDDFIYADPPYDVPFTKYASEDFSWEDQIKLAEWLAVHSGPVVVSNQATSRILELYRAAGFHVTTLTAPRKIACNGDRTPALEMLAWRNLE